MLIGLRVIFPINSRNTFSRLSAHLKFFILFNLTSAVLRVSLFLTKVIPIGQNMLYRKYNNSKYFKFN